MSAIKRHTVYKDALTRSRETGEAVRALCGRVWIPVPADESEIMARPQCMHCERAEARLRRHEFFWVKVSTQIWPTERGDEA